MVTKTSDDSWSGWLVSDDGKVFASVEVPTSFQAKSKGLLGRSSFEGALFLKGAKSVHTFGMQFDLDIAFISKNWEVIRTVRLGPNRFVMPVIRAAGVIEAEAGAFSRWELQIGDKVEIRE